VSKKLIWSAVIGVIVVLAIGAVFRYISTNNKPDTIRSIVNDIHETVTPDSHKQITK
jgi:hypothetical protein